MKNKSKLEFGMAIGIVTGKEVSIAFHNITIWPLTCKVFRARIRRK